MIQLYIYIFSVLYIYTLILVSGVQQSDCFIYIYSYITEYNFSGSSDSKESDHNMGDLGSIPGSGRSPGERSGNQLQYSCLENAMGRGAWWATVHGVTKNWT